MYIRKNHPNIAIICVILFLSLVVAAVLKTPNQPVPKQPTPASSTSPTSYEYANIEDLVKNSVCQNLYSQWRVATIANTLDIKIPSYITQDMSYGGQYFIVKHPTLGEFSLSTILIGDYAPHEVFGFNNILQDLITSRKESFNSALYYSDNSLTRIIIGNPHVIVVKESEPLRWWAFNILKQKSDEVNASQFMMTNDFKCLLRSASFK